MISDFYVKFIFDGQFLPKTWSGEEKLDLIMICNVRVYVIGNTIRSTIFTLQLVQNCRLFFLRYSLLFKEYLANMKAYITSQYSVWAENRNGNIFMPFEVVQLTRKRAGGDEAIYSKGDRMTISFRPAPLRMC